MNKHLQGKQLTATGAIKAKCYDCMNAYRDGKQDCCLLKCPLYLFMPYRKGAKIVMRKKAKKPVKKLKIKNLPPKIKVVLPGRSS